MRYVVYIDVFFATNFLMDFLVMILAGRIIRPQTTILRCFLAAVVGAAITCIILVINPRSVIVVKIITYGIISSIMVMIGYRIKNIKKYVRAVITLYLTTFVVAGIFSGIYFFTAFRYMVIKGIPIIRFIFLSAISFFITDYMLRQPWKNKMNKENDIYDVTLRLYDKEVTLKALYDSGNSLMEPIEKIPVHIVEYDKIKPLIEGVKTTDIKIRIVPYKSLGKDMGWLKAIELNEARINLFQEEIVLENILVGVYEGTLSQGGVYNMILNRSVK